MLVSISCVSFASEASEARAKPRVQRADENFAKLAAARVTGTRTQTHQAHLLIMFASEASEASQPAIATHRRFDECGVYGVAPAFSPATDIVCDVILAFSEEL